MFKKAIVYITTCSMMVMMMSSIEVHAQKNTSLESQKSNMIYTEEFTDDSGEKTNIEIYDNNKEVIVKTYVNENLVNSATIQKLMDGELSNKIVSNKYDKAGKKIVETQEYMTDDIVKEQQTEYVNNLTRASYSYLEQQYLSRYMSYATLYGYNDNYTRDKLIYVNAWSPISVVIGVLYGFFTGGSFTVYSLINTLGGTVVSGLITDTLDGSITQNVSRWNYQCYIRDASPNAPNELAGQGFISNITTKVYNTNGSYKTYYDVESSGSYKTRQEFIDMSAYIFYL